MATYRYAISRTWIHLDVLRISLVSAYSFDKSDSITDEKFKRQLQYHIAARQGPISGVSSQWDYKTGLLLRLKNILFCLLILYVHYIL